MSDNLPRTNRWLIALSVILCLILGGIFTRSSAVTSQADAISDTGAFVSEDQDSAEFTSEETLTDSNDNFTDSSSGKLFGRTSSDSSEASPGGPALRTDISPEASEGSWASSGSNWMFLVDDKPYTGWFTDTDGKQYYMDETGIMQTGWTDIGKKRYYFDMDGILQTGWTDIEKKRYYFDMDGILQTGTVIIDKKTYELDTDGSLKDYTPKKKSSKKKSSGKSDTSDKSGTSTAKKSVALTFDDGPSSFTDRLLDCLEENNAKATFFMVGTEIASFPDEVKRMKKLGCELGNHTYDHKDLATLSSDEISSEIARVDEQLVNLTGEGASVVRPPYGSVNDTVKSTVGTPMILWSIDTLDWKTQDVESTVEEVMNNVKDGSIILMHDIFSTSVDAAEILIPQLIEEGYQLVTVHELASLHQTELSTGVTYGEFNRIK